MDSRANEHNTSSEQQLSRIQDLIGQLQKEQQISDELRTELETAEKGITSLREEIGELEKEIKHYQRKVKQILNSRSWRYLSPARKIANLLRSSRNGKKRNQTMKASELVESKKTIDNPIEQLKKAQPKNVSVLIEEYRKKKLDQMPDTFVLYRILGNDLYPRHKKGQTRQNLKFLLENEPELENCEKRWIVNRIIDKEEEEAIIALLKKFNQPYLHIPFNPDEYRRIGFDTSCVEPGFFASRTYEELGPKQQDRLLAAVYRLKNNYVMNNNGARNAALRDGRGRAKWILPWDGNCFLTKKAWQEIVADIKATPYLKYFVVPMARVIDNQELLSDTFTPNPVEEPQIIFRTDALEEFNEEFCYGRRPKVELFWRLGIPGDWDNWKDDPWDVKRRELSPEAGQFGVAGWVARMFSGMQNLELDSKKRGLARTDAIISTLQHLDASLSQANQDTLTSLNRRDLEEEIRNYRNGVSPVRELVQKLIENAEEALQRGPYSVVDKTTLPPSGNKHDYWHPAPYWWPNPNTDDGLPYIQKNGQRVPGTRMYEPESEKYDRTRLQRLFDDSFLLALAWKFTGDPKYARHGAALLETFFVKPETRMNPHLNYAQVRLGHNNNMGYSTGIIEMKDLYYYLDAVRLLSESGFVSEDVLKSFREWLKQYLNWLLTSPQGEKERAATNNHGTYYDLQVAAIAAFLNHRKLLYATLIRAQSRLKTQFAEDGSQPEELKRTITQHYCYFNLQGWIHLAELSSRWGVNLWAEETRALTKGVQFLLSLQNKDWPYPQMEEFDRERIHPIRYMAPLAVLKNEDGQSGLQVYNLKPVFHPHDGIRPYWNIGLSTKSFTIGHFVVMRYGIGILDEKWLEHRLKLFQAITLPSLLAQTSSQFFLCIQVDKNIPEHYYNEMKRLTEGISNVTIRKLELHADRRQDFQEFIDRIQEECKFDYIISTRMDDDDALTSNTFEMIIRDGKQLVEKGMVPSAIIIRSGMRFAPLDNVAFWQDHKSNGIGLSILAPADSKINIYSVGNHMKLPDYCKERGWNIHYIERNRAAWLYTIHKYSDTDFVQKLEGIKRHPEVIIPGEEELNLFSIDRHALKQWIELEKSALPLSGGKATELIKEIEQKIIDLRKRAKKENNSSEVQAEIDRLLEERKELGKRIVSVLESKH